MLLKFSVKKPYTVVVAVVIDFILGAISFINLQTDLLTLIVVPVMYDLLNRKELSIRGEKEW